MTMWDERFSAKDWIYGTRPNEWLVAQASRLARRGRVLSLGEGEGRNAVWLAEQGFAVDAVDSSAVGLGKAQTLASRRGVAVETTVADLANYRPHQGHYDGVVLIYIHLPPSIRTAVHRAAQAALKPGGMVILEAFTPRQLNFRSGGPKDPALLYEPQFLQADFPQVLWEDLREEEVELSEGAFHQGRAAVLRAAGRVRGPVESCF